MEPGEVDEQRDSHDASCAAALSDNKEEIAPRGCTAAHQQQQRQQRAAVVGG